MKKNLLPAEFCGALLILLFGYTAISKAMHIENFRRALAESPVAHNGAGIIAWLVILAEALIVLLLFFPGSRRIGLYASFGLLSLFTGYLIYMVSFAEKLPCGCGGVISQLSWNQHIFFNLFFLLVNGLALWNEKLFHAARKQKKFFHA
jgi:hypothetical protein